MQQQEQGAQMAMLRLRYFLEITANGGSQALGDGEWRGDLGVCDTGT